MNNGQQVIHSCDTQSRTGNCAPRALRSSPSAIFDQRRAVTKLETSPMNMMSPDDFPRPSGLLYGFPITARSFVERETREPIRYDTNCRPTHTNSDHAPPRPRLHSAARKASNASGLNNTNRTSPTRVAARCTVVSAMRAASANGHP